MDRIFKLNSKRKTRKTYFLLGSLLFILLSMVSNFILLAVEQEKYEPPGRLIEIDEHKVHLYGTGK